MIIPGADTQAFAATLAEATGERLGRVEYERFPDGEHVVRVPEAVSGERAVVVASTVDSDAHLQLLQLQDAARESGASEVITVIPYMATPVRTRRSSLANRSPRGRWPAPFRREPTVY